MKLYYEIEAPNGEKSYLFGTCHHFFDIPKEIIEKLNNGSINHVFVEFPLDEQCGLDEKKENHQLYSQILDMQIASMAREKGIPVTSLDRHSPNLTEMKRIVDNDINDIKDFFHPTGSLSSYQKAKQDVELYLKQDIAKLAKLEKKRKLHCR